MSGLSYSMKFILGLSPLLLAASAVTAPSGLAAPLHIRSQPGSSQAALANRAFGLELYRNIAAKPGNNFISPISLAGAFGPVAAGAQGETRLAIGRVFGFPSSDAALHPQLGGLLRSLNDDTEGARVSIANALWVAIGLPVKRSFIDVATSHYSAEVANLDFHNGAAAAARINEWVNRETKGRIPTLIEADSLDHMTALVVTNAVHFLGDWTVAFNASNTRPQPFHLSGGAVRNVPMMYGKRHVRYADVGPVQMIDLPYKGERLSMSIILPKTRDGLAAVEAQLSDKAIAGWLGELDEGQPREVHVHVPKVKVESSYQLVEPLKQMGMGIAFEPGEANFRGIAETDLFISQVVHKTFLRIDEKGTEAAAATGVEVELTSAPVIEPPTFRADHPFLLLIRDKRTGAVLFLGRIADPTAT